jgi:hypothetical protein
MMLKPLFSARKPNDKSSQFYKMFYSSYSLLQVNDIIMNELLSNLSNEDRQGLVENIVINGFEMDKAYVLSIAMNIMDESLEKRKNENRGIDLSLFKQLQNEEIDVLQWYLNCNEYINLYAIFEQTIKEFLVVKGVQPEKLQERTIMNKFFEIIHDKTSIFFKELSNNSDGVLEKQNEVIAIWNYFTKIRHLYMHSGGRITERFKNNMYELKAQIGTELEKIESKQSMFIECLSCDIENFFVFEFENEKILNLNIYMINFFRNYIIILIEAIEEISKV